MGRTGQLQQGEKQEKQAQSSDQGLTARLPLAMSMAARTMNSSHDKDRSATSGPQRNYSRRPGAGARDRRDRQNLELGLGAADWYQSGGSVDDGDLSGGDDGGSHKTDDVDLFFDDFGNEKQVHFYIDVLVGMEVGVKKHAQGHWCIEPWVNSA
jgi:hypothetical protein